MPSKAAPPTSSHGNIQNGCIFYLKEHNEPTDRLHPGVPRECLGHPVVILDTRMGSRDNFVDVLIVTSFGRTPLEKSSNRWRTHLPIESPEPHPWCSFKIHLKDPETWDGTRISYVKIQQSRRVHKQLLEPLRRGPAKLTENSFRGLVHFHNKHLQGEPLVPEKQVTRRRPSGNNGKTKRHTPPPPPSPHPPPPPPRRSAAAKSNKITVPAPETHQGQEEQAGLNDNEPWEATESNDTGAPEDHPPLPNTVDTWPWVLLCLLGLGIMFVSLYLMDG